MKYFIEIRDFLYYNRKKISLFVIVIIVVIVSFFSIFNDKYSSNEDLSYFDNIEIEENSTDNNEIDSSNLKEAFYFIDIKGSVKNPGVYQVSPDKRVIDIISIAGGLLPDSDTSNISMSQKIEDEMVILIPSINEKNKNENSSTSNNLSIISKDTDNIVSINSATLDDLMTIKGIGKVKAEAIIEYRKEFGPFKSIEDIKNVSGIGSSTFEKIKDYIKL